MKVVMHARHVTPASCYRNESHEPYQTYQTLEPRRLFRSVSGILGLLALGLALAGCGGLASEPEIIRTAALPTVTPTAPPDLGHPPARVNLQRGAELFGGPQGCAACHGIGGKGDGEVAANFACKLPNFTDAENARSKSVNAWFAITTNGNNGSQQCLMPPWKSRLNEQQRWDVTSYIYSLHYTPDQLAQGKQIWQDKCAECHGPRGAGDGPKAKASPRPVPNFSDPGYLVLHSDTDLWNTVTNGLGSVMPAFKDQLDDNARWAAVAYLRAQTWDAVDQVAMGQVPAAGGTAAVTSGAPAAPTVPDSPTIAISGKVSNGTANAAPPKGLALTLRVIDLSSGTPKDVQKLDTTTGADGAFTFANVPRQNGMVYVVVTTYGGILQTSTPVRLHTGSGPTANVSFKVYEVTADPAVISVDLARMFIEPFSQDTMLIRQAMSFRNTGDRVFLTDRKTASGDRISVETPLPAAAQQIQLAQDSAQQFVINAAQGQPSTIQGVVPVLPGEAATMQFTYLLPYASHPPITIQANYPVEDLTVFVPQAGGLSIADQAFSLREPLQLQNGVYNQFALQRPLRAGEAYTFPLADQNQQAGERRNVLAVVLILAMLAIIGTVVAIWRLNQQRAPAPVPDAYTRLVQSIAELDDRYARGKMAQDEYNSERARLKAEVARYMQQGRQA